MTAAGLSDLVVEVLHNLGDDDHPDWSVGSGFFIGTRWVLTALHNVDGPGELLVRVHGTEERPAVVCLQGKEDMVDLAVLEVSDIAVDVPPLRYGAVDRSTQAVVERCSAVGFPRFKERAHDPKPLRLSVQVDGEIPTGENLDLPLLTLRVRNSPRPLPSGAVRESEWEGISGATVFSGNNVIVGVITEHSPPEGESALTVVPITAIDQLPKAEATKWWQRLGVDHQSLVRLPGEVVSSLSRVESQNHIINIDNNTATIVFRDGERRPFLAPPRPSCRLTGRDGLLDTLKRRLLAGDSMPLLALNGLPGVGKTALAIELAYDLDVLEHFQDGVLWAGLGRQPDILTILSTWGMALGISSSKIVKAISVEDRAKTIRAAISRRKMLLVIDDAWQVESALAFKVGGPNCALILTTRLPDVAIGFAGTASKVDELSEIDGLALLRQLAPEVVESELTEAQALVQAVGGLPLALILIGKYLRVQAYNGQSPSLREVLSRLHQAVEWLRLEQPQATLERHPSLPLGTSLPLQASIGMSEQALDEEPRYALRALSVLPPKPNSFSEEAALAISDMPVKAIDTLKDSGLLEGSGPGRYTLHQTIADYVRAKYTDAAAYERMIEFFVNYVEDHKADSSAIDPEMNNVTAALQAAFERRMWGILLRGVKAFSHFLDYRGLYTLEAEEGSEVEHALQMVQEATQGSSESKAALQVLIRHLQNISGQLRRLEQLIELVRNLENLQEAFKACTEVVDQAHGRPSDLRVDDLDCAWQRVLQGQVEPLHAFVKSNPNLEVKTWFSAWENQTACINDNLEGGKLRPLMASIVTYSKLLAQARASVHEQVDQAVTNLITFSTQTMGRLDIS